MRQIRQTLRLRFEVGLTYAQIARAIPAAKATVGKIIVLARAAGGGLGAGPDALGGGA